MAEETQSLLQQNEAQLRTLLKERASLLSGTPAFVPPAGEDDLSVLLSYIASVQALQKSTAEESNALYPGMISAAIARSPNHFPREVNVGCRTSVRGMDAAAAGTIFPAGRIITMERATGVLCALMQGRVQFAILPVQTQRNTVSETFDLIRRFHAFVVGSFRMENGWRYLILSRTFQIFPEADRACILLQVPDDSVSPYLLFSYLGLRAFRVLRVESFPSEQKGTIRYMVEFIFASFAESNFSILDQLDTLCCEFLLLGIYFHKDLAKEKRRMMLEKG